MTIDLKNIHFHKQCIHLFPALKRKRKVYFELKNKLQVLINFFFYKKLRGDKLHIKMFKKRWNKLIPNAYMNSKYKTKFFTYFKNVYKDYVNKNLNIVCVCDPIDMKMFGVEVKTNLNLITEEQYYYNIYMFYFNEKLDGIQGIIANCFKTEFRKNNFNLILHDIKNNKIKYIKLSKNIKKYLKQSVNIMRRINRKKRDCSKCIAKGLCKYEH